MGEIRVAQEGAVATVTLSNPERRNAICAAMWAALKTSFDALSATDSIRCIVVRGAGHHFAGGADISEFPLLRNTRAGLHHYHMELIAPALAAISNCVHPTLAAIEGACVGGGLEIAGRCDLRLSARSGRFGIPINRLGFPIAPDELSGILGLVGRAVTLELLLEARILDAEEAYQKGLVTRLVDDAKFEDELRNSVDRLTASAPIAQRINKRLVNRLAPEVAALTEAELAWAFGYAESEDHREGISAYIESRTPHFVGK